MTEIEHFMPLLMQQEEEGVLAPLLSHGRVHFLWIKHSNLYCIRPALVGRTRSGERSPAECRVFSIHGPQLRLCLG